MTTILRLAWNALLYYVWQERNHRVFRNRWRTYQMILKEIKEVLCIKLLKLKGLAADSVNNFV